MVSPRTLTPVNDGSSHSGSVLRHASTSLLDPLAPSNQGDLVQAPRTSSAPAPEPLQSTACEGADQGPTQSGHAEAGGDTRDAAHSNYQTSESFVPLSTRSIAKPSATQDHSVAPVHGQKYLSQTRKAYAMELEGKIAQIPLKRFMSEFVPGPDIPEDFSVASFDSEAVKDEKTVYDELVSHAICS